MSYFGRKNVPLYKTIRPLYTQTTIMELRCRYISIQEDIFILDDKNLHFFTKYIPHQGSEFVFSLLPKVSTTVMHVSSGA